MVLSDGVSDAKTAIDVTFPQAHQAIRYDLDLLTNRRAAQQFGPLATIVTGLNYRLVERLRTIRAIGITPIDYVQHPHKLASGAVSLTTDRGATTVTISRSGTWAPFAGCRPRVLAYAEIAGELIRAAVIAEPEWGVGLATRFDKLMADDALPTGECSVDALVATLVAEFELDYDLDPPKTAKQFRALVVGDEPSPGGYLVRAVARVGGRMLDDSLRHELAAVGTARVPYADLVRESRLTQLRASLDAAQILWKRLRDVFRVDADTFELPFAQQKATLAAGLRRTVESVLKGAPLVCSPPTLKLFAASRWQAAPQWRASRGLAERSIRQSR
jgi:hypothetical protein